MSLVNALKIIHRNRRTFPPRAEITAGHIAEQQLAAILSERLVSSGYDFHQSLRIPYKRGRREVDFVITTPDDIWLVELKNWSGFVALEHGRVIQHRSHGRGIVDHGNLLKTMLIKERALRDYLKSRLDEVPPMVSVLVFWNQNVALSDELLATDDVVVVGIREFVGSLPPAPPDYGIIVGALARLFGALFGQRKDQRRLMAEDSSEGLAIRKALGQLGSWDMVRMHGGRILSGDILEVRSHAIGACRGLEQIQIDAPRSWLHVFRGPPALSATTRDYDHAEVTLELSFEDTLLFQAAGQPKAQELALRDLEMVVFGGGEDG
ncbi:MAG: nuclease-related domain-containing protein [Bradymonadaceae bacterium]